MADDDPDPPLDTIADTPGLSAVAPPKVIPAGELFGDAREVWIDFHGERYRLRITRRNKLILQK